MQLRRLKTPQPSWYKKHRAHLILFADIFIILVFIIVYNTVLRPDSAVHLSDTHRYELRALQFNNEALISLKIMAKQDLVLGSSGIISLEFSISEDFVPVQTVQEVLPDLVDQPVTLYIKLPSSKIVYARGDILSEDQKEEWDFNIFSPVEEE